MIYQDTPGQGINGCIKKRCWIKYQLLFMWLFFFAVYLPFFILMFVRHDINTTSLSVIGWSAGGIPYLILYLVLTLPFCLYLIFFFNKHFIGGNKFVKGMSVISCAIIIIGACFPVREAETELVILIHTWLTVGGTIVLMLTILFALILHAISKRHKAVFLLLYGMYVAVLLITFHILYTAALFQLAAAMSFFLILLLINTSSLLH